MQNRVNHLQRPGSDLTACGQRGPYLFKTFDAARVTCNLCRQRGKRRIEAPPPMDKTAGRVIQPGGGRRR